jgi:hypothetical protein
VTIPFRESPGKGGLPVSTKQASRPVKKGIIDRPSSLSFTVMKLGDRHDHLFEDIRYATVLTVYQGVRPAFAMISLLRIARFCQT